MRRASISRPSETSIIALTHAARAARPPRAAGADCGSVRPAGRGPAIAAQLAPGPAPASPIVPLTQRRSPGRPPPRDGHRGRRRGRSRSGRAPAARRAAERSCRRRAAAGRSCRSAAASAARRSARPSRRSPRVKPTARAERPRALGGEIGEVHRDQLPGDVAGGSLGQDNGRPRRSCRGSGRAAADSSTAASSSRPRAAGSVGERAQRVDEGGFAHAYSRGPPWRCASSRPLTKPLSRSS